MVRGARENQSDWTGGSNIDQNGPAAPTPGGGAQAGMYGGIGV